MKNNIPGFTGILPALIQNVHLTLTLTGWPAAVAIIAISLSGVTIYTLKILCSEALDTPAEQQHLRSAA